jgi:spermidine synthase
MTTHSPARQRNILYVLFVLSGVSGLIYESIWSHYLKLFLGHAAYAQTLVLAIFMGGMAIGAWIAGGIARRATSPLLWYAAIEGMLGVAGLGFDPLFRSMQAWMFDSIIPGLESPLSVDLAKWGVSALVILPQSILLGATFPLMSSGIVRLNRRVAGGTLSWLYFTNSLGASIGVLLSGFVLIGKVGLPGTLLTAGLINFLLALGVYLIARHGNQAPEQPALTTTATSPKPVANATVKVILIAAFFTGTASFFYEIGWIRMLSLVLGTTTRSFELMLSAFIFGLAAGAFWIRNRIDGHENPLRLLGWIQICMATSALLTLTLYMRSFEVMAWFSHAVESTDRGYLQYNLFSSVLCFALMLPATFCAGMTLPLMTAILLRNGHGEVSIGRVYALNTAGAIVGILLAVHVCMPIFGLRQVVIAGALIDLLLGAWLLHQALQKWRRPQIGALAAAVLLGTLVVAFTRFDPAVTASGAYRVGKARVSGDMLFHADGKTATVDVWRNADGTVAIATNGKVDAGFNPRNVGPDDYTMTMLALLPTTLLPDAKTAAVIGMGSGTSTHTLLLNSRLDRVDTVEIEPAIVEGARHFGATAHLAYDDPRSHIHIEDAKTFFARSRQGYDVVISEPSNPWVSGIASLFSREFYAQVKRRLNDDGLFVQWLHLYEISPEMIASVVNALGANFADYAIFASNDDDIIIVAKASGKLPALSPWVFQEPAYARSLERLDFRSIADVEIRRLGGKSTLDPYFSLLSGESNSDYFPVLDQSAARQRFLNRSARALLQLHPYTMRLDGRSALLDDSVETPAFLQLIPGVALRAAAMAEQLQGIASKPGLLKPYQTEAIAVLQGACADAPADQAWLNALATFTVEAAYYLPSAQGERVVDSLRANPCAGRVGGSAQTWIGLLEGIVQHRPSIVQVAVAELLGTSDNDLPTTQFLVAELLLADIQGDAHELALEHLRQASGLPDSLALTYLRAYILAQEMSTRRSAAAPARSD